MNRRGKSDAAFQRLWTKYAALPEYVKDEWTAAFNEIWAPTMPEESPYRCMNCGEPMGSVHKPCFKCGGSSQATASWSRHVGGATIPKAKP